MKRLRTSNLVRPNRFYRGIAIFFLLFTAVDLSSLWPCAEDGLEGFAITRQAEGATPALALPASNQSEHSSESESGEHDCFCCCAHVSHVARARFAELNHAPTTAIPRSVINLPIAPPQGTDHPPRHA